MLLPKNRGGIAAEAGKGSVGIVSTVKTATISKQSAFFPFFIKTSLFYLC
jgi:hypothetical protein